jgi:hypothetical protein
LAGISAELNTRKAQLNYRDAREGVCEAANVASLAIFRVQGTIFMTSETFRRRFESDVLKPLYTASSEEGFGFAQSQ